MKSCQGNIGPAARNLVLDVRVDGDEPAGTYNFATDLQAFQQHTTSSELMSDLFDICTHAPGK
jgi:hypothetical protein